MMHKKLGTLISWGAIILAKLIAVLNPDQLRPQVLNVIIMILEISRLV